MKHTPTLIGNIVSQTYSLPIRHLMYSVYGLYRKGQITIELLTSWIQNTAVLATKSFFFFFFIAIIITHLFKINLYGSPL